MVMADTTRCSQLSLTVMAHAVVLLVAMLPSYHCLPSLLRRDDQQAELPNRRASAQSVEEDGQCFTGLQKLKTDLRGKGFPIPDDGTHRADLGVEGGSSDEEFEFLSRMAFTELLGHENGTICETGFNYGTSAYSFLCSTQARVVSFDLGEHKYVESAKSLISTMFPGRFELVIGDSTRKIPQAQNLQCDFFFVDGGWSQETAKADIQNFMRLAKSGALLVVDDCGPYQNGGMGSVTQAWNESLQSQLIEEAYGGRHSFTAPDGTHRSVCLGRYRSQQGVWLPQQHMPAMQYTEQNNQNAGTPTAPVAASTPTAPVEKNALVYGDSQYQQNNQNVGLPSVPVSKNSLVYGDSQYSGR